MKRDVKAKNRIASQQEKYGWFFTSAALVLVGLFLIYPFISSFLLAMQNTKGMVGEFDPITNVKRLVGDLEFRTALKNTFIFFIIQVPIMLTLALVLASILNSPKTRFKGFFRTAIFLPTVTSLVAYAILFKMLFSYDGIVNKAVMLLPFIDQPIQWLTDPFWAKITIIMALTWRWTGYNMIFYLAGMQNIPPEIYEAAELDGASKLRQLVSITIPSLKPIILFTAVMSTIGTLQLFDEPMNLTSGGASSATFAGTLTLSQYIYNLSFKYVPSFGYAAMVSYVIVLIVAILSYIQFKVAGDDND